MAGSGRRKRASKKKSRQSLKDHHVHAGRDESDPALELIALSAIFGDDFTLISEDDSVTEFSISLQPHLGGLGSLAKPFSAELHVRCFHGYPYKPPKLHVNLTEGLSEAELELLHSLLVDQAISSSREGRVMVFNLVEAAQEFLSEHVGSNLLREHKIGGEVASETIDNYWGGDADDKSSPAFTSENCQVSSSVYGIVDLFTELGNDMYWDDKPQPKQQCSSKMSSSFLDKSVSTFGMAVGEKFLGLDGVTSLSDLQNNDTQGCSDVKQVQTCKEGELTTVVEGSAALSPICKGGQSLSAICGCLEMIQNGENAEMIKDDIPEEIIMQLGGSLSLDKCCSLQGELGDSVRKDLLIAHLLRLLCCPQGPLHHAWPALIGQLRNFNLIPQWTGDLVTNKPQLFDLAFHQVFADCIKDANKQSATVGVMDTKGFWNVSEQHTSAGRGTSERNTSRYLNDFEEISLLGRGGFGYVVLCRNKLDGRHYAVKKIQLKDRGLLLNRKIIREVATLSRLQHHHIVRYYQAWFETVVGLPSIEVEFESSSEWFHSSKVGPRELSLKPPFLKEDQNLETTWLYIQMEYCPRTLKDVLNSEHLDEGTAWDFFRQIVEGLTYIHAQGIIHRDLTPSNIFFDVRNDIKIGDFGLAKFLNIEQTDRDSFIPMDQYGSSLDGTGQVGTYLYTAPEIENGWPQIDEKVDMYSLGVILFELWHPFDTAMERSIVLSGLKNKVIPASWAQKYAQQVILVQSLTASNPAERPSAMHVLKKNLPPRMEDEALCDVLHTIQRAENTYVMDQIVSALFDDERVFSVAQKPDQEQLNSLFNRRGFSQDRILKLAKDVFVSHGALYSRSQSLNLADNELSFGRQVVRVIDSAGRMLELRSEMRSRFAQWVALNHVAMTKHFEISQVYRKAAGPAAPGEFYQGDFDIVGETSGLAEAETIKVVVDIIQKSGFIGSYNIFLNHASILEAIWSWSGVRHHERMHVAKLLSSVGYAAPHSSDRKSRWGYIRRQLVQGLQLQEAVVNRLQIVERRWNGTVDEALPRIRGALAEVGSVASAIDELCRLQSYLRVWTEEKHVYVDALMAPVAEYYDGMYFQIHLPKGSCPSTSSIGMLLATGGRYDQLIRKFWTKTQIFTAPPAVGVSIALEKLILAAASEGFEQETGVDVLVCAKGGGGFLKERMELVSSLWDGNIKATFLHTPSPSVTEQYEFANDHGIKWLIMITEAGLTHNFVKVRNIDLRKDDDVYVDDLVKFFTDINNRKTRLFSSNIKCTG